MFHATFVFRRLVFLQHSASNPSHLDVIFYVCHDTYMRRSGRGWTESTVSRQRQQGAHGFYP